ncbi:MAG: hypothetical protein R3C26_15895 [Calditrichia bacterium]
MRGPGSNGGAHITIINSIAYDNETTFRTEDDLEKLLIYNSTFDIGTGNRYFQNASGGYDPAGFDFGTRCFSAQNRVMRRSRPIFRRTRRFLSTVRQTTIG